VSRAPGSRRVIATYLILAGLFTLSAALIWGINTLFLLDAGLDIFGVFVANAAFTAGMVVFELPTGVLADTAGRRLSFLLSLAILSLTTVGYVLVARVGGGLLAFCAVSVVMGLGFTFYSGAVEAWLVDALKSTGFEKSLDQVFARGAMVTGGAMLTGTLAGGFLGDVDLERVGDVRVRVRQRLADGLDRATLSPADGHAQAVAIDQSPAFVGDGVGRLARIERCMDHPGKILQLGPKHLTIREVPELMAL